MLRFSSLLSSSRAIQFARHRIVYTQVERIKCQAIVQKQAILVVKSPFLFEIKRNHLQSNCSCEVIVRVIRSRRFRASEVIRLRDPFNYLLCCGGLSAVKSVRKRIFSKAIFPFYSQKDRLSIADASRPVHCLTREGSEKFFHAKRLTDRACAQCGLHFAAAFRSTDSLVYIQTKTMMI